MLPELLRFSSAHQLLDHIPTSVQAVHGGQGCFADAQPPPPPAPVPRPAPAQEDDSDEEEEEDQVIEPEDGEIDDDMLGALGL